MPSRYLLPALAGLAVFAAVGSGIRATAAGHALRRETARTDQLESDLRQLNQLRGTRANARLSAPPEDDVLRSVSGAIRAAGLNPRAFSGLSTNGDEAVRGRDGYRRKAYRLELTGLDAAALGAFLHAWQTTEPLWSVEGIDLRKESDSRRGSAEGYAVTLTISTVYAASGEQEVTLP